MEPIDMNLTQLERNLIIKTSGKASRIIIGNTLLSLIDEFEERGVKVVFDNHSKRVDFDAFTRYEDVGITTITITFSESDRAFIDSLVTTLNTNMSEA